MWAILSVLSGFFDAVCFALMKKLRNFNVIYLLALRCFAALPFILVVLFFYGIPKTTLYFYFILVVNAAVALLGYYLIIKSLQEGSISKSIPMLSFSPVFLVLVSYILIHELPSRTGFLGILIVVVGSYTINIRLVRESIFMPFKVLVREKSVMSMLFAAFLFSISSTISKIAIQMTNPGFFMVAHYVVSCVALSFPLLSMPLQKKMIRPNFNFLFMLGISTAATELLYAITVKFALVSYIIALKRTSVLFSVVIGYLFFKEQKLKESFLGASLMFIGAVLIVLS